MHFTLPQITAILVPLLIAFVIILLWYKKDHEVDEKVNQEKLVTLISVFFWSAFGGLMLKLFIDTVFHFDTENQILSAGWFLVFTVFLEEIIKGGSLIMGVELADQKFNEVSDGIIYGVMAALGFFFFENIFYLLNTSSTQDFFAVLFGRYLSTFGIHLLSTSVFGLTYAKAYLGYEQRVEAYKKKHKIKGASLSVPPPYAIFHHFRIVITAGNHLLNVLKFWLCWDLLQAVYYILTQQENKIIRKDRFMLFPSIFIIEGFLLGFYLHLACNKLLQNELSGWLLLTIMPVFSFVVYLGFVQFDRRTD